MASGGGPARDDEGVHPVLAEISGLLDLEACGPEVPDDVFGAERGHSWGKPHRVKQSDHGAEQDGSIFQAHRFRDELAARFQLFVDAVQNTRDVLDEMQKAEGADGVKGLALDPVCRIGLVKGDVGWGIRPKLRLSDPDHAA